MVIRLAQFWGCIFVIIGIILLIRRESVRTLFKIVQNEELMMLTGYMTIVAGVAHILLYNVWSAHWTIIITLIGWLSLVKGVIRLLAPETARKMIKSYDKPGMITTMLIALIIVGVYLLKKGFGV